MQKPIFFCFIKACFPRFPAEARGWYMVNMVGSVGTILPLTHLFLPMILTKCPHLCGRGRALLPFVLRSLLLPRSFPFQCCCLTSVCHIPDPPPAQPGSFRLFCSLSPIRQPHQNCKLGNLWGYTSHYEQLIKFHTKTQKTPNTSSWGNPTEQTKDKLCQTALWKINRAAIEAQFPGTF